MITKVFTDANDNQLKVIVNTKNNIAICVGDLFGEDFNVIELEYDDVKEFLKEFNSTVSLYKSLNNVE